MLHRGQAFRILVRVCHVQCCCESMIRGAVVSCVKRLTVEGHQLGKQGMRATALGHGDTPSWSFTSCALRVWVGLETIHSRKRFHPADRISDAVVDHPL